MSVVLTKSRPRDTPSSLMSLVMMAFIALCVWFHRVLSVNNTMRDFKTNWLPAREDFLSPLFCDAPGRSETAVPILFSYPTSNVWDRIAPILDRTNCQKVDLTISTFVTDHIECYEWLPTKARGRICEEKEGFSRLAASEHNLSNGSTVTASEITSEFPLWHFRFYLRCDLDT
jgi:hypothetical protein